MAGVKLLDGFRKRVIISAQDPQRLADMMADFTGVEDLRTLHENIHRSLLVDPKTKGFRDILFIEGTKRDLINAKC